MGCGAGWRQEQEAEEARKRARYDVAIGLLRELVEFTPLAESDDGYCEVYNRIEAFLADEPAERGQKEG